MEPFTPVALRGPVPVPPQRINKAVNSVSFGINPPNTSSALPPNVINSVSANQTKLGNERLKKLFKNLSEFPKNDPHSANLILPFVSLDPVQTLASDFGFEDSFNHSLKVEEKKNHQNRIAPPRQHPPLPPRKAPYVPSNLPPVLPAANERAVPIQANAFTPNAKPECVHYC